MTYNVFGGTLNLARSIYHDWQLVVEYAALPILLEISAAADADDIFLCFSSLSVMLDIHKSIDID